MNKTSLFCLPIMILAACTPQKILTPWTDNYNDPRNPAVVLSARDFIIQRQGCDHFRGEPGYNEERQKFLNQQIEKLCTGTDQKLAQLRMQYADSPETIKALAEFEDCIEYTSICSTTEAE